MKLTKKDKKMWVFTYYIIIGSFMSMMTGVGFYFYAYLLGNSVMSSMFQALFISGLMGHLFAFIIYKRDKQ